MLYQGGLYQCSPISCDVSKCAVSILELTVGCRAHGEWVSVRIAILKIRICAVFPAVGGTKVASVAERARGMRPVVSNGFDVTLNALNRSSHGPIPRRKRTHFDCPPPATATEPGNARVRPSERGFAGVRNTRPRGGSPTRDEGRRGDISSRRCGGDDGSG